MGADLPKLTADSFERHLADLVEVALPDSTYRALFQHYEELCRWNRSLSLVGPGTVGEVLARHYAESLAGASFLGRDDRALVDLGSGAGFPGWILAAAIPSLDVTLVEARQRKWAFLMSATRRAALSCRNLNARVGPRLPEGLPDRIDWVTSRALRISPEIFDLFVERNPQVRFLLWQGESTCPLPRGWAVARELRLPGSERRRIVEIGRR